MEPLGTLRGPTKLCGHSLVNKYAPRVYSSGALPCVLCMRQWGDTAKVATHRIMAHCRGQQMNTILGTARGRLGRRQTEHASGIHKVEVISDRYLEEFESSGWWTGKERTASSSVQRAKAFSVLWKGTRTLKPLDKNTDSSAPPPRTYWTSISGSEAWKL